MANVRHNSARQDGEPETKKCTKCSTTKPIEMFSIHKRKRKNTSIPYRNPRCKKCINAYHIEHRKNDKGAKQRHLRSIRKSKVKLLKFCDELRDSPCLDCGQQFKPWQMQFDHVRGEKLGNVMNLAISGRTKLLMEEIEKCEIVCANCHADRTHKRRKSSKRHSSV